MCYSFFFLCAILVTFYKPKFISKVKAKVKKTNKNVRCDKTAHPEGGERLGSLSHTAKLDSSMESNSVGRQDENSLNVHQDTQLNNLPLYTSIFTCKKGEI